MVDTKHALLQWFTYFFDKTSGTFEKTGISPDNQQLVKEFQKLIF